MDQWTEISKQAQDYLFRRIDENGYYMPHQAIYGFASFRVLQFCEIQTLVSCLDSLEFESFLDVGCAEGLYPRIVKVRYGADAYGMDFSASAIQRMWEYNNIEGLCGDAHNIPIKSQAFDVVLCNDMIEHVTDPIKVISELIRITKKHLFIGVPLAMSDKEIKEFKPDLNAERDQHVHIFTPQSFRNILPKDRYIKLYYSRSMPTLIMNSIYKRLLGKIGNFFPIVKLMLKIDRIFFRSVLMKPTHALAQIDLTYTENSKIKRSDPVNFILKDIYSINKRELEKKPIYLGTQGSISWREFRVKASEVYPTRYNISKNLLNFLSCSKCLSEVTEFDGYILCNNCKSRFKIWNGIPIMNEEIK
ncbi:MAG: methyltransferase domain-containing protein [bacterium]